VATDKTIPLLASHARQPELNSSVHRRLFVRVCVALARGAQTCLKSSVCEQVLQGCNKFTLGLAFSVCRGAVLPSQPLAGHQGSWSTRSSSRSGSLARSSGDEMAKIASSAVVSKLVQITGDVTIGDSESCTSILTVLSQLATQL
jgi:hypothetical protein